MSEFIIIKHAGASWQQYWNVDPKLSPQDITWSAKRSYTGKHADIQDSYTDKTLAQLDCDKMNQINPIGNYAVCTLKKE